MAAKGAPKTPIGEAPGEGRPVAPGELRGRLAVDLGEDYELLHATLQDAMTEGSKNVWVTCTNCKHKGIYLGPDYRTRLDAAAKWVELGLGRKREEAEPAKVDLVAARTEEEMRSLTDAELYAIIAAAG